MMCKHCEHSCHCNHKCTVCECLNCEHNALDDFWKRLDEKEQDIFSPCCCS